MIPKRLSRHTGNAASHQIAEATVNAGLALVGRIPHAGLGLLSSAAFLADPPLEITFMPDENGAPVEAALSAVHRRFLPNLTLRLDGAETPPASAALRMCREHTCLPPLHTLDRLEQELETAASQKRPTGR